MGDILSKQNPNPSSSPSPPTSIAMASSDSSETHYSTPKIEPTHQVKSEESSDPPPVQTAEEEEEEEEGECGFCLFMKGGGCKEVFTDWEKCVEEGERNKEDIVDKCFEVTRALKECMQAHSEYYAPILRAEEVAEAEAVKELEKEKEIEKEGEGEKKEVGSVSESAATIEVNGGGNFDARVEKKAAA